MVLTEVFRYFSQYLQTNTGILTYLKLYHHRFLPCRFKFIVNSTQYRSTLRYFDSDIK